MNGSQPFFSVIVPTYERPAQLSRCLQSFVGLDYPRERFEIVVVDDGGADQLDEVIARFRPALSLQLLRHEHTGPAGARNLGSRQARGEFLAFTDDDCQPDAGWLRELAHHCLAKPDQIIGGRTVNALPQNPYSETSQAIIESVYSHFNADPGDARFFASNNFAVSAELFRQLKGFAESFVTSEDREFCARWRSAGRRLSYAPSAVVYHAHDLCLRTLWRQHFGYGRGARRFHRARSFQGDPPFKPEPAFYVQLFKSAASRPPKVRGLQFIALLFWAQLANAAGFFSEKG
jgi:glycosyltransferase involved in cell wall biosynthesis